MKKVTDNLMTGTIAEDKVGVIVQEKLGFLWRPQTRYDVGYDGEIEIRDEATKEALGLIVKVQSKAVQDFDADTVDGFTYKCDEKDFDYWMKTNIPDIIVITKSKTNEMYWSPIKKYFEDNPRNKKDRKIIISKKKNVFDEGAKSYIYQLGVPKDSGLYLPPLNIVENLYTNLMPVKTYPYLLHIAQTQYRDPLSLISMLKSRGEYGSRQWILYNKAIYSFSPLDSEAWKGLYDEGTLETYNSSEWADGDDEDKIYVFSRLLNKSLGERCYQRGILFDSSSGYYYFGKDSSNVERQIKYQSIVVKRSRYAIKGYVSKKDPSKIQYYKHLAFYSRFVKYDDKWYLQINPTYHFTFDGKNNYQYYEQLLKGIKRLQKNRNVLGDLISISDYLKTTLDNFPNNEEIINLDQLQSLEINGGIDDEVWIRKEEN